MKHPYYAELKVVDNSTNVLLADNAKASGGTFGIWVNEQGLVMEGSVDTIAIVTSQGDLVSPPAVGILEGCTFARFSRIALRENAVKSSTLRPIRREELYKASEVLVACGDTHVFPVVQVDDKQIGYGTVGPVFERIIPLLQEDCEL